MFAPLFGIPEDPATGSANAALVALLAELTLPGPGTLELDVEQGREINRPSRILARAEKLPNGEVRSTVAGQCVPVFSGRIDLGG